MVKFLSKIQPARPMEVSRPNSPDCQHKRITEIYFCFLLGQYPLVFALGMVAQGEAGCNFQFLHKFFSLPEIRIVLLCHLENLLVSYSI